jgi:hypothetical protein
VISFNCLLQWNGFLIRLYTIRHSHPPHTVLRSTDCFLNCVLQFGILHVHWTIQKTLQHFTQWQIFKMSDQGFIHRRTMRRIPWYNVVFCILEIADLLRAVTTLMVVAQIFHNDCLGLILWPYFCSKDTAR